MQIYVDGGCRRNGQLDAIGAAAAVLKLRAGRQQVWSKELPNSPRATNQRAEITAIILALEQALYRSQSLNKNPYLDVTIYSDSQYAVRCMNEWVHKWSQNGWRNAAGRQVANRDLIEEASELSSRLEAEGDMRYVWIPREENQDADEECNQLLNEMEERRARRTNMYDTDSSNSW